MILISFVQNISFKPNYIISSSSPHSFGEDGFELIVEEFFDLFESWGGDGAISFDSLEVFEESWKRFNNVFDISSGAVAFNIFFDLDKVDRNIFDGLGASGGEEFIDFIFSGLTSTFLGEIVKSFIE